jgi:hypothetical protein
MIRRGLVLGLVLVGGSLGGCGGDDGPKAMPGTMNSSIARSSVQQSLMVRTAADSMNGSALASAVRSLNTLAGAIVSPQASTTGALLNSDVEQTAQAQTTGATCDASGCKYTNFMAGGTTFNGNVTVSPGSGDLKNVKWDLTMKQSSPSTGGLTFDNTGKGDIQVSLTSLSGEIISKSTFAASQSSQSFSSDTESVVKYTAVIIANGQPTGGSVYAKTTSFASSGGQSAAQAWDGTLEFGK